MLYADLHHNKIGYDIYGHGYPLLLLHGVSQTRNRWGGCIEALSQNFSVIVPDLRGHGKSDNPDQMLSVDVIAHDIAEFIVQMKFPKMLAWGFSLGGHVLLSLAIKSPHLFNAIVVESCAAVADRSLVEKLRNLKPEVMDKKLSLTELKNLEDNHLDWRSLYKLISTKFAEDTENFYLKNTDIEQMNVPCLLICGDRDPFFPMENVLSTFRHLVKGQLFVLPNTGHGVREKYGSYIDEIVLKFLRQHSESSSNPNLRS